MKAIKLTLMVGAMLCALVGLAVVLHRSETGRYEQLRKDPTYVGFRPLVESPRLDNSINQYQFTFSINNDIKDKNSWRTAFYPTGQGQTSPYWLDDGHILRLGAGAEVEIKKASNVMQPNNDEIYFIIQAKGSKE
jgi:hypothetical protein